MKGNGIIKITAFIAVMLVLLSGVAAAGTENKLDRQKAVDIMMPCFLPLQSMPSEQHPIVTYIGSEIRGANEFDSALGNLGEKIVVIKFAIYNPGPLVIGVNQIIVSRNASETISLSIPHIFQNGMGISKSTYWMVNSGSWLNSIIYFDVQQAITVGQTINLDITISASGTKPGDTIQIAFDSMNWFVDPWSEFGFAQTGLYNRKSDVLTFPYINDVLIGNSENELKQIWTADKLPTTLMIGEKYWIKWDSAEVKSVSIALEKNGRYVNNLIWNLENNGGITWTPDRSLRPGENYQIVITEAGENGYSNNFAKSGNFTIEPYQY